jgi:3-oxoadipate enol-lactonase
MVKIEANGIEIHYEISGHGPWVTLSHSLACNLSMWDGQMKGLTRKYTVLRYDTRGHGQSDAPAGTYTLEQLADDAKGLLDALGIEQTHWVGLSMGGMIGMAFALKYPGTLRSMVLADTTSQRAPDSAKLWEERLRIAREQGMEPLVENTIERFFTDPYRISNPHAVARIGNDIRNTPTAGYIGCLLAISKIDLTDRLKEIMCPAIILVGEHDQGTPVPMAQVIHQALPGSDLQIIPRAAHLSNIEQPEVFNKAMLDFLDRHSNNDFLLPRTRNGEPGPEIE